MRRPIPLIAAIAALAAIAPAQAVPPLPPVPFRTVAEGQFGGIGQKRSTVIRGERRWRRLWNALGDEEKRPDIDFSRHMAIAVTQGRQSSSGHGIAVARIERTGAGWLVRVRERAPATGCPAGSVITSPYHVVRVKRTRRPVRFERRRVEVDCR